MTQAWSIRRTDFRRARATWAMVWLAVLLNALAPVIAYGAMGALQGHEHLADIAHRVKPAVAAPHPRVEHARTEPPQGQDADKECDPGHMQVTGHAHTDLDARACMATATHEHAPSPDREAARPPVGDAPTAAHCQYCPDFAAGAPLSVATATEPDGTSATFDVPSAPPSIALSKPHHRLRYARGPPTSIN